MRILILGGTGMLGHKLWQSYCTRFDTWITTRSTHRSCARYELFDPEHLIEGVDAFDFDTVIRAVTIAKPDVVINCIGIIKQLPAAKDPITSLTVNALFPHRLAKLCQACRARLIHISTDCVFSGRKGNYREKDVSDSDDLYGRTKFLGEVGESGCLTLRTSIIGRELQTSYGLVEWFLGQRGVDVRGYTRAIYTGFPTQVLANIIAEVIERYPDLSGVYHVSSDPISKYDLLHLLRDAYGVNVTIIPDSNVQVDRSLNSSQFRAVTNFSPSPWIQMIQAMAEDATPYAKWKE